MRRMHSLSALTAALWLGYGASSYASGFALIEQSASGQGLSYAGAAANTEDASVMWFNPAGLSFLDAPQAIAGVHYIHGKAPFTNEGSYITSTGDPLYGKEDDGAKQGFIPNLYLTGKAGEFDWGVGFNVPYGSTVDYDQNWVGRYHAVYTETKTYNINPAISRKFGNWSVGGGLSAQYISVNLTQKIDFSAFGATQSNDGYADLKADSLAYGYNFGAIYQFGNQSKLGLAFRSQVAHSATGDADFTVPDNLPGSIKDSFKDTNISASVDLPATLSLSYVWPVTKKMELLADATWTGWSSFQELRIKFDNPLKSDSAQPEEWKDVMRYALGMSYQLSDDWKLRTGFAYDETPIKNKYLRTPRIVDSDRLWASVGFGYQMTKSLNLDVGYTHIFGGSPEIEATHADTQDHVLKGKFDINIDILSAQLVWKY